MTISLISVKSLLIEMSYNGQKLATGTGFVVIVNESVLLLTNRHNFTGRDHYTGVPLHSSCGIPNELTIMHNRKGKGISWTPRKESLFLDGSPLWIEHPLLGCQADIAALRLRNLDDVELFPYDLANPGVDIVVGPADIVSVVGFPFGLTGGGCLAIWATGFVASEPDVEFEGLPTFLIDSRTRRGQSGSVVIAHRGAGPITMSNGALVMNSNPVWRFLGMYSGRLNNESDIGRVWKIEALRELAMFAA